MSAAVEATMGDIDHTANCLTNSLKAASEIAVAMCLFDRQHAAQANLVRALHCALIVTEECRQGWLQERPEPSRATMDGEA